MARLLVVHHTVSPALEALFDAAVEGARDPSIEGVEVVARPALVATAFDALEADGYLLGTPANLGYVSGALKHFFDTIYYPCRDAAAGRPFGLYVHGQGDTAGARRAVDTITTGLGWKRAAADVVVTGAPTRDDLDGAWNLGATLAAVVAGEA